MQEAAVQREEVPEGPRRAEAVRRDAATRRSSATWARPTFEVNGLLSGFTGEGAKTVLPAVAMAKVSMRLVPDQDPDKIAKLFEDYVRKVDAEDRRAEGHADARRQAVDDGVRQPVRAGRGTRDRAGLRARRRCSRARADRSRSSRRSRRSSACRRCCSASACRTRTRTRRTRSSTSANFHNGIIASALPVRGDGQGTLTLTMRLQIADFRLQIDCRLQRDCRSCRRRPRRQSAMKSAI